VGLPSRSFYSFLENPICQVATCIEMQTQWRLKKAGICTVDLLKFYKKVIVILQESIFLCRLGTPTLLPFILVTSLAKSKVTVTHACSKTYSRLLKKQRTRRSNSKQWHLVYYTQTRTISHSSSLYQYTLDIAAIIEGKVRN